MEPFAEVIRDDKRIEGLNTWEQVHLRKASQYTDDTTLFFLFLKTSDQSLQIIEPYALASGSKLKTGKSLL